MALYKRGNVWWVSIWRGGKHIQKSTGLSDKRMARAVEQALMLSGEAIDGSGRRVLCPTRNDEGKKRGLIQGLLSAVYGDDSDRTRLDSIWMEYEEVVKTRGKKIADRTLKEKKSDFVGFVKWAEENGVETLDGVTAGVARKYSVEIAKKVSVKRRSNLVRGISSVWNAVLSAHPGIVNPWPQVAPVIDAARTTRKGFSADEEKRVLEAARKVKDQWYVACQIGRYTGLRYGDVCRMIWENVDMKARIICLTPSKTKDSSGVVLRLPMAKKLYETMVWWVERNPRETKYDRVLPWLQERSPKGKKRFRAVLEAAGVDAEKFSFHSWRHTLASRMGEAGVGIEVRKRILGHTTDVMAERYNHADLTDEMRRGIEATAAAG